MSRSGLLLVASLLGMIPPAVEAGEPVSGPRPLRPRPGAVFRYSGELPRIKFRWKESGPDQSYILQIVRVSSAEVATFLVRNQPRFSYRPRKGGRFRWWVASLDRDGKPTRPGPARYFRVARGVSPPLAAEEEGPAPAPLRPRKEKPPKAKPGRSRRLKPEKKSGPDQPAKKVARLQERTPPGEKPKSPPPEVSPPETSSPEDSPSPSPPEAAEGTGFDSRAAPELQAPNDGARILTSKPRKVLLFWKPVGGARDYEVVLGSSAALSGPVTRRRVKGSMLALRKPPRGTTYWRVRALDESGNPGAWSSTWRFDYQEQGLWGE